MNATEFLRKLDPKSVVDAIRGAESQTTGEIRVFVSRHATTDVSVDARRQFDALKLHKTTDRNAVLFYFVPGNQQFAIVGDTGIHSRVGADFWPTVSAQISERLRAGEITAAVVEGIQRVGNELATHFPSANGGRNEFPDSIERD